MRSVTRGSLFGMKLFLDLNTSIGEAFKVNWATCQQLANEGTQSDPTRVETPLNLNWPVESSSESVGQVPLLPCAHRRATGIVPRHGELAATGIEGRARGRASIPCQCELVGVLRKLGREWIPTDPAPRHSHGIIGQARVTVVARQWYPTRSRGGPAGRRAGPL